MIVVNLTKKDKHLSVNDLWSCLNFLDKFSLYQNIQIVLKMGTTMYQILCKQEKHFKNI